MPDRVWPDLIGAAGFEAMRAGVDRIAPNPSGILKDSRAFFRRGRSGAGAEQLADHELAPYRARVAELAPPDLVQWLHRDAPDRD